MTAEFPAIVRFKRALAITLLLSGGGVFFSSTLSFLAGRFPFGMLASFAFIFAGVTLQKNTYFRLDRRELIVYKPTGKEDYRCALTSMRDLDLDGDELYIDRDGESRRVPLYRWLAEDEDWGNFVALVNAKPDADAETSDAVDSSDSHDDRASSDSDDSDDSGKLDEPGEPAAIDAPVESDTADTADTADT